jgi:hypothetical protein
MVPNKAFPNWDILWPRINVDHKRASSAIQSRRVDILRKRRKQGTPHRRRISAAIDNVPKNEAAMDQCARRYKVIPTGLIDPHEAVR